MKKLKAITLGCSKNRIDTEYVLAQVGENYCVVPEYSDEPVDYLLLNTCGFIGDAKQESIDAILEAVELKKQGLVGEIIVFGCLSQRYEAEMPELIPEVDAWFGARDIAPIVSYLGVEPNYEKCKNRVPSECGPGTAYLKISEGCDRRCSYCAIPHIRGAHRSVPMEDILDEARNLAAKGVKELILIAQDTTYYGLDLYRKRMLGTLIERLSEIPEIHWIRIHYSYPDDFPEDVLQQMATNPKVCKYLDIPLQHINDTVLANMRRHVTGEWTRNLIARMREMVPGVVLRTTMIVGHPGEGENEFEELMEFCSWAHFERLGAFYYSEEEGTYGALHFKDEVPQEVKQSRYDRLMSAQSEISLNFNRNRIGSEVEVMVDEIVDGKLICRSQYESPEVDGEIIVSASGDLQPLVGNFIRVRITDADLYDLVGEALA